MKALIVEDSRLARKELTTLLAAHPEIEISGEASTAAEALEILSKEEIDLLFLDINMPGKNGFELLEMLDAPPMVIFTTAYDEFALKSFDYSALDYLLKPVKPEALARAVSKAAGSIASHKCKPEKLERVFIKDGEKCWLVNCLDIIMFESEGNYSRVYFGSCRPLIYKSLNLIEQKIDDNVFFRANRRQIINLNFIKSVSLGFAGTLNLSMSNGETVEVSRRNAHKFRTYLSF